MTNLGKWDSIYQSLSEPSPYGDTKSYLIAEEWLRKKQVEDWGCGKGWFKLIHEGAYTGIDGSNTPFADAIQDLSTYTSRCESILLRHVLEHDAKWPSIWRNALQSAQDTIVLILFTPISQESTITNAIDKQTGVPDLSPAINSILAEAIRANKQLVHTQHIQSETRYASETILVFQRVSTESYSLQIPKIIHQYWDGPLAPPTELMKDLKEAYQANGWKYKLWNQERIKKELPGGRLYNQIQYDLMPEWSGKCDIARYEILQNEGGFFIDADTKVLRTIEDFFLENECFSVYENELLRPGMIACGYLGAKPNNPLIRYIISRISLLQGRDLHPDYGQVSTKKTLAWKTVGPVMLTKAVKELDYRSIAVFPSFFFIPNHYLSNKESSKYSGSFKPYCDSLWGSTPGSNYNYPQSSSHEANPSVSICTLTHNRKEKLGLLLKCIESQDFPHDKIEWVILDDSTSYTGSAEPITNSNITINYQRLETKLAIGAKRNLAHKLCTGDFIVYMDDDDFYPPERVSHAVSALTTSNLEIAGCTILPIFFTQDNQLWLSGPFGDRHATAGTFAMKRSFARSHLYNSEATCNEEKDFLKNYTIPMVQLDPLKTMICISHGSNTFDKNIMRANGSTARMRRIELDSLGDLKKHFEPQSYIETSTIGQASHQSTH